MADWLVDDSLAPPSTDRCAPFHAAAAEARLVLPRCSACERPLELDQIACHGCGIVGAAWHELQPRGHVHAATVVHRVSVPQVLADAPYVLIDVEFETGHRLVLTTTGPWSDAPRVGQEVQIGFRCVGGTYLPAVDLHRR